MYACISNTLLLTVLVSILSTTFAKIDADAEAEYMFRQAVETIEGVKSDALFGYQPPLNIFAWLIMTPAKWILSPRWFHKFNVFMVRATAAPILLIVTLYERYEPETVKSFLPFYKRIQIIADKIGDSLPRKLKNLTLLEGLVGSSKDVAIAFEFHPDEGWDNDEDDQNDDYGLFSENNEEIDRIKNSRTHGHYDEENELHKQMCDEIEQRRLSQMPSRTSINNNNNNNSSTSFVDRTLSPNAIQRERVNNEQSEHLNTNNISIPFPKTNESEVENDNEGNEGSVDDVLSPLLQYDSPDFPSRRKSEGTCLVRSRTHDTLGNSSLLNKPQLKYPFRPRRMSNVEHTLSKNIGSLNSPLAKAFSSRPVLIRNRISSFDNLFNKGTHKSQNLSQPQIKSKSTSTSPNVNAQNILQPDDNNYLINEKLASIDARQSKIESILERLAKNSERLQGQPEPHKDV